MNLKNSTFNIKAQCILPLLTLMLALLSPIGIYAQQKKDSAVIKLKEVVIQSQNSLDSRKLLPASVSIINKSALQISPKLDLLSEAEQTTPGLFITGKGIMGTGAGPLASGKITMRGLMSSSNSSTQILIDGVPMMMGLFGHPLSDAIEQSNVDRIEVLRGPSSLQYGGSALAGAINFISANPVPNTQNLIASMQWGSYGTVKRTFSGSIARDGYFIQAGYSHNATDGFRANSAFDNDDYFLRYGQNFSTHYQGILSVYRSNATTNDPGSIYDSNPTVTVTHVHRTLASYKVTNDYHNLKGGLTIYYQEGVNHFSDGWNSTDYLGGARLEEQLSPFKGNSILAGTETKWYGGKGSPVGFPTSPLNDVWIRQTEQSAFLVMQQKAGESLLFNAGLRTTHHSLFGFTTSPSVGATFTVCKNTFLRGLYSSGFRNPTIGELFYFPPANATLKPEKAGNVELGMNSKLCDDRLSLDLTLFSIKASDLIFTVPAPENVPPVKNLNASKVSNTGLELSAKFVIGNVIKNANVTDDQNESSGSTNGTQKDEKSALSNKGVFSNVRFAVNYMYLQQNETILPYSPKHKLNVQACTSIDRLLINLEYQFISGMYTDYPAVTSANYNLVDLAFIYPLTKKIQLKATGNNLFNEKYQIMKGYPMPGRVLMGGFTINLF